MSVETRFLYRRLELVNCRQNSIHEGRKRSHDGYKVEDNRFFWRAESLPLEINHDPDDKSSEVRSPSCVLGFMNSNLRKLRWKVRSLTITYEFVCLFPSCK